jgi:hypothetical protein
VQKTLPLLVQNPSSLFRTLKKVLNSALKFSVQLKGILGQFSLAAGLLASSLQIHQVENPL